ncbi:hypothetical protein SAMN06265795_12325 [Noviherbaspirillum humi]|uniref:Uncharacterized protein n=1 Tax=Noviherbaspirillum humi TaxID=1688639 RepID=A0A239LKF8_9BURK|nr:hypothetical protein SAMN06265795_12325 [Noviherbaspirillum humi]
MYNRRTDSRRADKGFDEAQEAFPRLDKMDST